MQSALAQALTLAKSAVDVGAEFLLLPEYCGGLSSQNGRFTPPVQSEHNHLVLNGVKQFAREQGVYMLIGSVAIEATKDKFLNRSFIVDDKGEIVARYDKINLFDITLGSGEHYRESDLVQPGTQSHVVELPFARVGMSVCYDLRFPTLYREMAQAGAEILMVPAAFTAKTGVAHWHVLNRARAIENSAFVVSPCAIGEVAGGGQSYGHSLIINPWGEVIADGGDLPGVVHTVIDLDEVAATRSRIPSWQIDNEHTLVTSHNETAA